MWSPEISLHAQTVRLPDSLHPLPSAPLRHRPPLKIAAQPPQVVARPDHRGAVADGRLGAAVAGVLHRSRRLQVVPLADDGGPLARLPFFRHFADEFAL